MLIREVSLEADISRIRRSSHLVYIAPFCYNYSVEKWEEIESLQEIAEDIQLWFYGQFSHVISGN